MNLQENINLKPFNTLSLAVNARYFTIATQISDLQSACEFAKQKQLPLCVLGGGSNVVFTNDFPGLVILMQLKGIELTHQDKQHYYVKAAAGENWHDFVMYCLDQQYFGLENLSLIPGTVGAAPIQNIGAYGVEIEQFFDYLQALDVESGDLRCLSKADCEFAYRDSVFKNALKDQMIIIEVGFKLNKKDQINCNYPAVKNILNEDEGVISAKRLSDLICNIRQSKLPDPTVLANVGSFFKNPVIDVSHYRMLKKKYPAIPGFSQEGKIKIPAAWLIEQCQWKGFRQDDAGVYDKHALVLVNYASASSLEMMQLSEMIQRSVQKKFSVNIEPEPRFY